MGPLRATVAASSAFSRLLRVTSLRTKEIGMTKLRILTSSTRTKRQHVLDIAVSEISIVLEGVQDVLDAVNATWKTLTAHALHSTCSVLCQVESAYVYALGLGMP